MTATINDSSPWAGGQAPSPVRSASDGGHEGA